MSGTVNTAVLASKRLLVIDAPPSTRGVLEAALAEAGADVWMAGDGASALLRLATSLPDLVLLYLEMPGMDGWAVLDALRAKPGTARLPVVLMSSSKDYASYARARDRGVAAFVAEPFRLSEVIGATRRILEGSRPGADRMRTAGPVVELRDASGARLGLGQLLDLGTGGAQVAFDRPLNVGDSLSLVFAGEDARTRAAKVRWVRRGVQGCQHGLKFQEG